MLMIIVFVCNSPLRARTFKVIREKITFFFSKFIHKIVHYHILRNRLCNSRDIFSYTYIFNYESIPSTYIKKSNSYHHADSISL